MEIIEINSIEDLSGAADKIIRYFDHYRIVAFYGHMGAGKTTLINAICDTMGVEDQVTSPTFAIVNQYLKPCGEPVYHFDFYRIDDPREAFDMGYEEYFAGGDMCLIEWPENITGLLPVDTLEIHIDTDPANEHFRRISIVEPGDAGKR